MTVLATSIIARCTAPICGLSVAMRLRPTSTAVTLRIAYNGGYAGHIYEPNARIGFSAHGVFKRSDFGVDYGIPEPGTTMGVSDEVSVRIDAEFTGPAWKDAPKPAPSN